MMWGGQLSREIRLPAEAETVELVEGNMGAHRHARGHLLAVVKDPITYQQSTSEPERSRIRPDGMCVTARSAEGR